MGPEVRQCYQFETFRVDLEERALYNASARVALPRKAFDALEILLLADGKVVSKDDLMRVLWADTFVDESNLTQTIFLLRKALGDTGGENRYVLNVPGRGYRFGVVVRRIQDEVEVPTAAPEAGRSRPSVESRGRRALALAAVCTAVVLAGLVSVRWLRSRSHVQAPSTRVMFAVLPFENLTGDPGQEYFSDGLTEEMIGQLGRTDPQRLGVIARTSVMHYKNSREPLSQIGSELGVEYLLEGSVRRDSSRVRISAKLIQARDQTPIWAREYDRDEKSLLALQSEIAQEIADEIQLTLGHTAKSAAAPAAAQSQLSPAVYEAHDLYLQGLYSWNKRTIDGFRRSAEFFQQAVAKDPNNALAYAGLANSYALIGTYNMAPPSEAMEKARAAALRALQLDEKLPQAHTALALIVESYDWDWQAAEREYQRAIQLDPSYATAHQWYAEYLAYQGRFDEAFAESARARQLDPLSVIIAADHAAILYYSRQFDRSIEEFRSILAMEPNYPRAGLVIYAYVEGGRFSDALAEIEKRSRTWGIAWIGSSQAYVYGRAGEMEKARTALRRLERLGIDSKRLSEYSSTIVPACAAVGEKQQALTWLERLAAGHYGILTTIKVDPALDSLRGEPRFQELLRKTRLAP